jgi:AGCS family alanine or glycine:cation symporter
MSQINTIVWGIATICLVICGLYFTFKLKFVQLRFIKIIKSMKPSNSDKSSISPFKTLTLALAARIGVGSLAGIALGIYKGGVGVVFWIWLSAFLTLPNSFVESTLAVLFHERDGNYYIGGPAYYIKKGLGFKKLAIIYALIIFLCEICGFLAIQSNTIATSVKTYLDISPYITGLIVAIISYLIISKGLKRIANFTSFLVPLMGLAYMVVALVIIIYKIDMIPSIISNIFESAFNFKAFGWGIISSIIIGVQRGIFSSEAGLGTGAVASGTSDTKYPCKQGYIQMLGVYFTTFIICTSTAFVILTSNIDLNSFTNPNGIEITLNALNNHMGNFGTIMLIFAILSFAFSTIISGYYYGESNLKYLDNKSSKRSIFLLNIVSVLILFYGAIASPTILWDTVDIGAGLLAIINCFSIFMLRREIKKEYDKERDKI